MLSMSERGSLKMPASIQLFGVTTDGRTVFIRARASFSPLRHRSRGFLVDDYHVQPNLPAMWSNGSSSSETCLRRSTCLRHEVLPSCPFSNRIRLFAAVTSHTLACAPHYIRGGRCNPAFAIFQAYVNGVLIRVLILSLVRPSDIKQRCYRQFAADGSMRARRCLASNSKSSTKPRKE